MSNNHTSSIRTLRGRAKSTKKRGGFRSGIPAPMSAGACSPEKNVKIFASMMPFPAFWDHSQWKNCTQNYCKLMVGSQKGKNGWETTGKWQRSMLKRLAIQRNGEFQKPGCQENGRPEILAKNKKGRVGISTKCPHYRHFFVIKEVTPNLCAALSPPQAFHVT